MAAIVVTTAGRMRIVESIEQITLPAGEAILAGAPVRQDTSGNLVNGNGTTATEAAIIGIATKSVATNEALTVLKKGVLDGFTLAGAFGSLAYVSDTDATIADAAGTVSVIVGRVIAAKGQQIGTAADKLLAVNL